VVTSRVLAFVLMVAGCAPRVTTPPQRIAATAPALVGTRAPSFALPVIGGAPGELVRSADLAGHVALLDFWATWCPPCTAAVPHLNELAHRYAAHGLRIIGVSSETDDDVAHFAADNAVAYTLARDADDSLASAYQVGALPMLVLIDRAGIIRYVAINERDSRALDAAIVDALN
jgi:peroxiredoxin